MKKTIATALVVAAGILIAPAANASTDPWADDPATLNQHTPAVCDYAQYATPSLCAGAAAPSHPDTRPHFVRVKRHDTLWHLALVYYGNGHDWKRLAKLNHIHGTTIHTGQKLRIR